MNLIWFLTIGLVLSICLGEFGSFPFGSTFSLGITDILVLVVLIVLSVWQIAIEKRPRLPKQMWLMGFFWVIAALSLLLSGLWSGGVYLARFIVYSGLIWVGFSLVESKLISVSNLLRLFIVCGVLLLLGGIVQVLWLPDLSVLENFGYDPHLHRLVGSFLDPNFFGCLLAIFAVICVWFYLKTKRKYWLVFLGLFCLGVLFTFSRSAYLMLIIELFIVGIWKWYKMLLVMLVVLVFVFVTVPRFSERAVGGLKIDASASERLNSWNKGIILWKTKPVFGVGFNNIREVSKSENLIKLFSKDGGNSGAGIDSSLLVILATTGLLGLAVFIGFWVLALKDIVQNKENWPLIVVLVGLLLNGQFINSWFYPPIMVLIYLWVGASLVKEYK